MRTLPEPSNMAKYALFRLLMVASVLMVGPPQGLALGKAPDNANGSRFLVLNDCDDDNDLRTAPYGDIVYLMDSRGEFIRTVARGLTVTSKCGGLSVSEDGRCFAVCEKTADTLSVYEVATGRKLWSLLGIFNSAAFANGLVYTSSVDSLYAIDNRGIIVKHARMGVFDFTIDRSRTSLWISGLHVKKYNLDLDPVLTVERIKGIKGPLLVEMSPDGSIWVAQQDAYEQYGSENRLVRLSPEGTVLQTLKLDFCPRCVRVDQTNGSIWVTGKGHRDLSKIGEEFPETLDDLYELTGIEYCTQKHNSNGKLLFRLYEGGSSLVVDPFDGSVWITGERSIAHFSSTGEKLGAPTSVSGQKWLAFIPGAIQSK